MRRFVLHTVLFLGLSIPLTAMAQISALDSGLAITDPQTLRTIEARGLGIANFLDLSDSPDPTAANSVLKLLPSLQNVREVLTAETRAFKATDPAIGVGVNFSKRLFDPDFMISHRARFALVGIVSRFDRGYKDPENCGETRFIYRLAYRVISNGEDVFSRLPMTINLVLRARDANHSLSCAEIARRWLKTSVDGLDTTASVDVLLGSHGPLAPELRTRSQIDRLELNMQMVRWPAAMRPDFGGHAEYLLKVFKWNALENVFVDSKLENQIDRQKLLRNPALLKKFKEYIFTPENLKALDDGTIIIPDEFLATKAFSASPGGNSRSVNQPFYGLFTEAEIQQGLNRAQAQVKLNHILSPAGFRRRTNDITCTGCHQTRAIGGFHFMGRDPMLKYPGNSVFVPASGHFFGEFPRRRQILESVAEGKLPDYSRGYASRPQAHRAQSLNGSGLLNGYGAHCSNSNDASFRDWTCAPGLTCKVLHQVAGEPGIGLCISQTGKEIGDPLEMGVVTTKAFGQDLYTRKEVRELPEPKNIHVASPQSATPGKSTGGFPGGSIRRKDCTNLPAEAVCGALPAAKNGFNACVGSGRNYVQCLKEFGTGVGLRGCDRFNPCRDDYICSESYEPGRGACVPPYFLFQFRVDGHPIGKAEVDRN